MAAPASLRSGDWYKALTLRERVALLRGAAPESLADGRGAQRADRRLQSWRSQFPFLVGASLAERLKLDGVTEEEFLCLLGLPERFLRDHLGEVPAWWDTVDRAFALFDWHAPPPSQQLHGPQEAAGFLTVVEPTISAVRRRVDDEIQALSRKQGALPFNPHAAVELLLANLPGRLLWMLGRTMVLELHVTRLRKLLQGDTPAERFQNFIDRLRRPETALAILQEYPVLTRQLVDAIENWAAAN
jgi:hypothetical protein